MANRLVVDTNVFIEGLFNEKENDSSKFLSILDNTGNRLVFSQETIGELLYVLKKICNQFKMSQIEVNDTLKIAVEFFGYGKSTNTRYIDKMIFDQVTNTLKQVNDPDDRMFVEAAYSSNAKYIITLDKRSGLLDLMGTPFICCTPTDYLEIVNE